MAKFSNTYFILLILLRYLNLFSIWNSTTNIWELILSQFLLLRKSASKILKKVNKIVCKCGLEFLQFFFSENIYYLESDFDLFWRISCLPIYTSNHAVLVHRNWPPNIFGFLIFRGTTRSKMELCISNFLSQTLTVWPIARKKIKNHTYYTLSRTFRKRLLAGFIHSPTCHQIGTALRYNTLFFCVIIGI